MANKGYILEDATTSRIVDAKMAQTPMGEIYFIGNATDTVITTQSTFTKVTIVTTLNTNVQFDSPSAGRLRYTGSVTRMFHLGCTFDVSSVTNNQVIKGVFYKNGGVNANSEFTSGTQLSAGTIQHKTGTGGDQISTAIHVMVELATNDYIELGILNDTSTADLKVIDMNVFAMGGY